MTPRTKSPALAPALAFGLALAAVFSATPANAHFVLKEPANWMSQDSNGVPIKLGPCGDEQDTSGSATHTGAVTAFQVGTTITVTIDEVIFHPGHYRIALATNDRSQLPPEPTVDAGTDTPCGTADFEDPAVFPVLADNVLPHVTAFSTPQSVQVKLPDGLTCDHCTLQVIEFMSEHGLNSPGGCFYHHCADIKIQTAPVQPGDSTPPYAEGGAGTGTGAGDSDGGVADGDEALRQNSGSCGCSTPGGSASAGSAFALFVLGVLGALRSRRRRPR